MRKIEFRGVCNVRNIWVYGSLCDTNESLLIVRGVHHIDGQDYCLECSDVIPETVGQYTGLTDKNGVKIYEGDKLRVAWVDMVGDKQEAEGKVEFSYGCFWVGIGSSSKVLAEYEEYNIEVIGNIHEKQGD